MGFKETGNRGSGRGAGQWGVRWRLGGGGKEREGGRQEIGQERRPGQRKITDGGRVLQSTSARTL